MSLVDTGFSWKRTYSKEKVADQLSQLVSCPVLIYGGVVGRVAAHPNLRIALNEPDGYPGLYMIFQHNCKLHEQDFSKTMPSFAYERNIGLLNPGLIEHANILVYRRVYGRGRIAKHNDAVSFCAHHKTISL